MLPLLCLLPVTFCLLFPALPVSSETMGWAAAYGGGGYDSAKSIQQTSDGGYIVAGETWSFGAGGGKSPDIWVLKLRADGGVDWQKSYGGGSWNVAHAIQQTADGGYIVVGVTNSFGVGGSDAWVLKLRPYGTVEWQKTYGGKDDERANSVQQTSDGGYVVTGITESFGAGAVDIWVLKLRSDGTIDWQKTYGGDDFDWGHSIQETHDGGYIVAGDTSSFGARGEDIWVLKLRVDGTVEWERTYGGGDWDTAHAIQQTRDGGYIVAGVRTASFGAGGEDIPDIWVLKLKPDGEVEWQKTYGEDKCDEAKSVQQTRDGGYIVAGSSGNVESGTGTLGVWGSTIWVLKLRADGSVEWQKAYGGGNGDEVNFIQQTSDGGYIVTGWTASFIAGKEIDVLVLKLRPDGSIAPSCQFTRDTNICGKDSNATVNTTGVRPKDSRAMPQDSQAIVQATNASSKFLTE